MSGMEKYILTLARHSAPLLVTALLAACAGPMGASRDVQQRDLTTAQVQSPTSAETSNQAPQPVREPVDPEVIYQVLAGEYLGGENDLSGAAEAYALAAEKSNDPSIAERGSRIAYAAQNWSALDTSTRRWLGLRPESTDARQLRAIAHLQLGRVEAAVDELNWLHRQIPDREEAWATMAAIVAAVENTATADAVLQALLDQPDSQETADGLYGRSIFAYRLGHHEQAYELAGRAARLSDDVEIIRWAAQVAHAQNDDAAALVHYQHALAVAPKDRDLNLAYAELLRLNGQMNEAIVVLEGLPADSAVLYTLAVYANSIQHSKDTAEYYRRLRRLDGEGGDEHFYFCGQVAEALERYDEAVRCYRQVTGGTDLRNAQIRLAYALFRSEGVAPAREHLATLITAKDKELTEQAFLADAQILRDSGDLAGAIDRLSDGLAVLGDNESLLYMRGLVAEAMGDLALAEQDLRTIIQNDPQNAVALNALGYTLANRTKRYHEALSLIERAMALNPHDSATLDSMGWILYRLNRLDEAEGFLRQAFKLDPLAEIAAHLGEVLWQLGRLDEAREVLREAQRLDASDPALTETLQRLEIAL